MSETVVWNKRLLFVSLGLGVAAVVLFIGNLRYIAAAFRQSRIARPQRLIEEEAETKAATVQTASPWDSSE